MRKLELAVNLLIPIGSLVFGLLVVCLLNPTLAIAASAACFVIGLAMLVYAKCDLFRHGIWISFGPTLMTATARSVYRQAYALLGCGVALNLISMLTLYEL